jgi:pyrimidine operon attenuation protein/uracil phosphoribosyltransferase
MTCECKDEVSDCSILSAKRQKVVKTIVNAQQIPLIIKRLAHQVLEDHPDAEKTVFIGVQPRGIYLAERLVKELEILYGKRVQYGLLDITFYRDDFRNQVHVPNHTKIDFSIENKDVVIIDDVLYTGRTTRAALDALLDFGRPARVELCVLIDRRFSREFPILGNYVGKTIDTIFSQKVKVNWQERDGSDEVVLMG